MTQLKSPSVLIVGHGSSVSKEAEAAARIHAETLRKENCYNDVVVHFLTGNETLSELPKGDVYLMPFFMSEGYFVTTKISEIFGLREFERHTKDRNIYQCDAIGVDPMLSDILSEMAEECCSEFGYDPEQVDIILLAHGSSQSSASKEATEFQQALLGKKKHFNSVSSAYLEEDPSLSTAMASLQDTKNPVIILGMFAAEGPHATQDVPEAIGEIIKQNRATTVCSDPMIHNAGVVGIRPEIAMLIQRNIERRASYN